MVDGGNGIAFAAGGERPAQGLGSRNDSRAESAPEGEHSVRAGSSATGARLCAAGWPRTRYAEGGQVRGDVRERLDARFWAARAPGGAAAIGPRPCGGRYSQAGGAGVRGVE